MSRPLRLITFLALPGLLASCISERLAEYEERTFRLMPTQVSLRETNEDYPSGACVDLSDDASAATSLPAPRIMLSYLYDFDFEDSGNASVVGFESRLIRGQDPFPCNTWRHYEVQTQVIFDLEALPRGALIERASLIGSSRGPIRLRDTLFTRQADPTEPCTIIVGASLTPPRDRYKIARGRERRVPYNAVRPESDITDSIANVTQTVTDWIFGRRENRGFVFSVADGSAFVEHDEEDDFAYCGQYLRLDMQLIITARVPPGS